MLPHMRFRLLPSPKPTTWDQKLAEAEGLLPQAQCTELEVCTGRGAGNVIALRCFWALGWKIIQEHHSSLLPVELLHLLLVSFCMQLPYLFWASVETPTLYMESDNDMLFCKCLLIHCPQVVDSYKTRTPLPGVVVPGLEGSGQYWMRSLK